MREIEFRGLRLDRKEWIYGYYFLTQTGEAVMFQSDYRSLDGIFPVQVTRVQEDTIGQFTGLTDKNGVKIFEGDIVSFEDDPVDVVTWNQEFCCWTYFTYTDFVSHSDQMRKEDSEYYIIKGNIHQNPELLAQ
jgi:uncharacterized phage protein (TIGR01671 family)